MLHLQFNDNGLTVLFPNRIAVFFPTSELRIGVKFLKSLNEEYQASFIQECIDDIEAFLKPKLPIINFFHTCVHCTRSIDERDENTMRISKDDDVKYQCRQCKPLKPNRPR